MMHHAWWMHGLDGGKPIRHGWGGHPHNFVRIRVDFDYTKGWTMTWGISHGSPHPFPWGGAIIWGGRKKEPPHAKSLICMAIPWCKTPKAQ